MGAVRKDSLNCRDFGQNAKNPPIRQQRRKLTSNASGSWPGGARKPRHSVVSVPLARFAQKAGPSLGGLFGRDVPHRTLTTKISDKCD